MRARSWLSPDDRQLAVDELHEVDRGRGRRRHPAARPGRRRVPRGCRAAAACRRERRGRLRQRRPGRLPPARRHRHQHAGCAHRGDRRPRLRAPADGDPPARARASDWCGPGFRWSWSLDFHLGSGIQGKTLGIVGLGQIGTAVARRGRAFGMEIVYTRRHRADAGARGGARRRASCRSTSCSRRATSSRCTAR